MVHASVLMNLRVLAAETELFIKKCSVVFVHLFFFFFKMHPLLSERNIQHNFSHWHVTFHEMVKKIGILSISFLRISDLSKAV